MTSGPLLICLHCGEGLSRCTCSKKRKRIGAQTVIEDLLLD